jgi:hypothetical protein
VVLRYLNSSLWFPSVSGKNYCNFFLFHTGAVLGRSFDALYTAALPNRPTHGTETKFVLDMHYHPMLVGWRWKIWRNKIVEKTYNYGSHIPSCTKFNLIHKFGSIVCYCSKREKEKTIIQLLSRVKKLLHAHTNLKEEVMTWTSLCRPLYTNA